MFLNKNVLSWLTLKQQLWQLLKLGVADNAQSLVDGGIHRFSGGNAGKIEVEDFAYARMKLKMANVPDQNMIAIVDPSVEFTINTLSATSQP